MGRYLGPRAEFLQAHPCLNGLAIVGTPNWYDTKGDEAVHDDGLKSLLGDGIDEALHP